jgi:hypothetical protein
MNRMTLYACLFVCIYSHWYGIVGNSAGLGVPRRAQKTSVQSGGMSFDPLKQITDNFPGSIKFNEKRRVLEFCPDETCDGFVGLSGESLDSMKDFAYLYVYYFSDYLAYLPEWRKHMDAENTADRVLSKPEYRNCQVADHRESARCVLLSLSQKGAIRLIFVRYDEGKRNVVPKDILKESSEAKPAQK